MTRWLQHASEQHSICVDRHSLFNYLLLLQRTPIFALMQPLLLCIGLAQSLSGNVSHLIFHPGNRLKVGYQCWLLFVLAVTVVFLIKIWR